MDDGFTTRAIRAATRVPRALVAARATSAVAFDAAAPTPAPA
ncbi:MAG TPA: hypothetical protein VF302_11600 [Candidatus Limnocylindrales bacterium]